MSQFNYFGSGAPSGVSAPAATVAVYLDTHNSVEYFSTGSGWVPEAGSVVAKVASLNAAANNANVLTYTALAAGVYGVDVYEVSSNTPTAATLPAVTVVYTDVDTTGAITDTLADKASVSAANVTNNGTFLVNVAAGGTIVVATTSYAAGSGTALTFNIKVRISYKG